MRDKELLCICRQNMSRFVENIAVHKFWCAAYIGILRREYMTIEEKAQKVREYILQGGRKCKKCAW